MAVDLRIELFSIDLFRNLWHSEITDGNYNKASDKYACSNAVVKAVFCRKAFFQYTLSSTLYADYKFFSTSSIDFYLYLLNNMNKFIAYNELNVFERLLMSCAVVSIMIHICRFENNHMHLTSAPLCWAMYFDITSKNEFYDKGGWEELELFVETYNRSLLEHYDIYGNKNNQFKNDFLNARDCFEQMSIDYSILELVSAIKNTMQNYKISCSECRQVFYALNLLYCESDNDLNEFIYTECYLQILKLMLSEKERRESEEEIVRDPKMKQIAEVLDIVRNPSKDSKCELFEDKSAFYQQFGIFKERYRALNTSRFLSRLFIADSELDGKRCILCGFNVIDQPVSSDTVNDQVGRIKSAICETVIDAGEKDEESTKAHDAGKSEDSNQKKDNIDDVLRLFFTLGVEPATSSMLANLRRKKDKQKTVDLNNSCANLKKYTKKKNAK